MKAQPVCEQFHRLQLAYFLYQVYNANDEACLVGFFLRAPKEPRQIKHSLIPQTNLPLIASSRCPISGVGSDSSRGGRRCTFFRYFLTGRDPTKSDQLPGSRKFLLIHGIFVCGLLQRIEILDRVRREQQISSKSCFGWEILSSSCDGEHKNVTPPLHI